MLGVAWHTANDAAPAEGKHLPIDDPARFTLHAGTKLLTERQCECLSALFAHHPHAALEATWEIYQAMIAAY